MRTQALSDDTLDAVLAWQLTIAWAGEGLCQPPRLGWWQTDLVDELGGGDLLARLLPRTHRWAALEAARSAAAEVDAKARRALAGSEQLRTLFFQGFEVDERLADRLAWHKRRAPDPAEALPFPVRLADGFSRDALADALRAAETPHKVVPGGRELAVDPTLSLDERCRRLAAALLPWSEAYPMPFYRSEE